MVDGCLVIKDWTDLVFDIPDLVRQLPVDPGVNCGAEGTTNDLATLAKNWVHADDTAAVSRICSNLYACTMYLQCLCDPTNSNVRSYTHRLVLEA